MVAQFGTTSFIPKKPETPTARRKRGGVINIFFLAALIVFLTATAASVGVFLYQRITEQSLDEKRVQLKKAQEAFEPALIKELALVDLRIQSAEKILNSHVAMSAFFDLLEQSTLQNIQFSTFSYSFSISSPPKVATFAAVTAADLAIPGKSALHLYNCRESSCMP